MSDAVPVQLTPRCKAEQNVLAMVELMLKECLKEGGSGPVEEMLLVMRLNRRKSLLKVYVMCIKSTLARMEREIRAANY
jgi:hypothetical protein